LPLERVAVITGLHFWQNLDKNYWSYLKAFPKEKAFLISLKKLFYW
jgi:membrane glycosyltransferase